MESIVIIWLILPVLLLFLTIWSYMKTNLLKGEKEQVGMYFRQFLYVVFCLLVSLVVLYSDLISFINDNLLFGMISPTFLQILIFPVVLVVFAVIGEKRRR